MSLKINGKTTEETLTEKFEKDGKLLGDASSIITFAATAAAGEPLSLAAGLALIVKTAGSAVSAGTNIVRRFASGAKDEPATLPPYDRFRILFYVTCQKCFIEALGDALAKVQIKNKEKESQTEIKPQGAKELRDQLQLQIASLYEAEVTYLFCVEPLAGDVPLYEAFQKWTCGTLGFYGIPAPDAHQIADQSNKEARKRFAIFLASKDEGAEWMRNYLALTRQQETSSRLVTDLAAIRETLSQWTDPAAALKQSQKKAWEVYRQSLAELPDLKETMFSEQFGVRKVFVQPRVVYHIRGVEGDASKAQPVPDLGRLLGALISSRVSGEDLVILCGGPGSGKSTLCRVMASELAKDAAVHPVFLRLRRVKEGSEIGQFIEESLQKHGLISRLADLRDIPNLVLILDGFDELVMASRARLRHFFNVLREDLSAGPLRNARAIVSGRDTLFPRGDGLPSGSHVLSLQPFDKLRVKAWGTKWRLLHKTGDGNSFHPEEFIEEEQKDEPKPPLHHLVSWPLTLHLVARVHTAGKLEVRAKAAKKIEKAYLYRSILAETSHRQVEQAEGTGRLDPKKMRDFLRSLAWEMHSRSIDSMDPSEVMPILKRFYPDKNEQDLAELAEVAVVNSPELTKGEETGFEFVHKSFAEFLVGERFADLVERVAFKAPEFGSEDLTWRMSEQDAARELAPVFGIRLIPEEVQEMFEPMLGCFAPFSKGERVDEVVAAPTRKDGLTRIVERFEFIFADFLRGGSLETVAKISTVGSRMRSPLEAHANYCAGVMIIGTAASRQLRQFDGKGKQHRFFSGEVFKGAFWRCLCILAAGGITLDDTLAGRLLEGLQVAPLGDGSPPNDLESPLRLGLLNRAEGYKANIAEHLLRCLRYSSELERTLFVLQLVIQVMARSRRLHDRDDRMFFEFRDIRMYSRYRDGSPIGEMIHDLARNGMVPMELRGEIERYEVDYRPLLEQMMLEAREKGDVRHLLMRLHEAMSSKELGFFGRDVERSLMQYLEFIHHEWDVHRVKEDEIYKRNK